MEVTVVVYRSSDKIQMVEVYPAYKDAIAELHSIGHRMSEESPNRWVHEKGDVTADLYTVQVKGA